MLGGPSNSVIKEAVDRQLLHRWFGVSGSHFDNAAALDAKQAQLDELKATVSQTEDRRVRRAQLEWVGVAQYTIDEHRKRLALQCEAKALNLPRI